MDNIILISIIAAIIPTLLYAALIYWVDRYEKEPGWLLTAAFLWGAVPSIIIAFIFNSLLSVPFYIVFDVGTADALSGSLIAPPIEETIKGLMLLFIFVFWRNEIDSPLDGIIYGAMVGMGFAMVENVYYFVNVFNEGGLEAWSMNVFMRAVVFGLNHALYTSMTGLGIAIARLSTNNFVRLAAPIGGWMLAIFLHFMHNLTVSFDGAFFLFALIFDWGWVWLTIAIIVWALVQERRWIDRYLPQEVTQGVLQQIQYLAVRSPARRTRVRMNMLFEQGISAYRRQRHFFHQCSELAFKRHHYDLFTNEEHWQQVEDLRQEVKSLSHEVASK